MSLTCLWKSTVATAKGIHEADIPISDMAKLTKNKPSWVLRDLFHDTARHTAKLPKIPISVVTPNSTPITSMTIEKGMDFTTSSLVNSNKYLLQTWVFINSATLSVDLKPQWSIQAFIHVSYGKWIAMTVERNQKSTSEFVPFVVVWSLNWRQIEEVRQPKCSK
jgi:hypothetical protein